MGESSFKEIPFRNGSKETRLGYSQLRGKGRPIETVERGKIIGDMKAGAGATLTGNRSVSAAHPKTTRRGSQRESQICFKSFQQISRCSHLVCRLFLTERRADRMTPVPNNNPAAPCQLFLCAGYCQREEATDLQTAAKRGTVIVYGVISPAAAPGG